MADQSDAQRQRAVDRYGLSFKVSLPEFGVEHTHWKKLPSESSAQVKASTPTGDNGALPPARRNAGRLQLSDFSLGRVLGEGNYSRVFLGTLATNQAQMAVKVIDKKKLERFKKQAEPLMEKHVLTECDHPFIVKLLHTFQDRNSLYLVTEFVPGGELWNQSHRTGLRPSLATFYAAEILDALEYLHAKQIVHRDVKPENVLIAADGHVRLIDFGTAKTLGQNALETSGNIKFGRNFKEFVGTAEYMPPEAINNVPADFRSDLWSFGGTVFHLLTGHVPFKGGSEYLTFKRVLELKYRFPVGVDDAGRDLITRLFKVEPRERLGGGTCTADRHAAIKAHPFFAGIDWNTLHKQPVPAATPEEQATPARVKALLDVPPTTLPEPVELPPPPPQRAPDGRRKKQGPGEEEIAKMAAAYTQAEAERDARAERVAGLVRAGQAYEHAAQYTADARRRMAFHLDVRGQLTEELRLALRMPEPEPAIIDDIEPLPDSSDEEDAAPAESVAV